MKLVYTLHYNSPSLILPKAQHCNICRIIFIKQFIGVFSSLAQNTLILIICTLVCQYSTTYFSSSRLSVNIIVISKDYTLIQITIHYFVQVSV